MVIKTLRCEAVGGECDRGPIAASCEYMLMGYESILLVYPLIAAKVNVLPGR